LFRGIISLNVSLALLKKNSLIFSIVRTNKYYVNHNNTSFRGDIMKLSARNQLKGIVSVELGNVLANIKIQLSSEK